MKHTLTENLPKFLIVAMAIAAGVVYCQTQKRNSNGNNQPTPAGASAAASGPFRDSLTTSYVPIQRDGTIQKSYADVIDKIEPAVVKISTAQEFVVRRRRSVWDDPFLRRLYGLPDEPQQPDTAYRARRPLGLGSGLIVTKDGYILTNNHVIAEATEIKVSIPGRAGPVDAKVIDTDPENDVAVIKVEEDGLPVATLADSSQVRRGDIVFAVGAPFGFEQSVSIGIISAVGRREVGLIGQGQENLIQTDAAINPGNSGGPLIDADGRVIGLNTAIYSNTGSTVNIGFAIPINRVVQIAASLVNPKQAGQRGYLGVIPEMISPEMAKILRLPDRHGAYVKEVTPGSPGAEAGLQVDDVILELQGRRVENPDQFLDETRALPAGREIVLGVWRDGAKREVKVKLGDQPKIPASDLTADTQIEHAGGASNAPYGLTIAPLNPTYRAELGLSRNARGLVIENVLKDSAAANGGLQTGDLIVRINKYAVGTLEEGKEAFARSTDGASMLHIWRQGRTGVVVLQGK